MAKRKKLEGEITCTSSSTLEPISQIEITFKLDQVDSTLSCGLRQHWADGEINGKKFDVTSGAGLGSPYLTFNYDDKQYCVHLRTIVDAIFKSLGVE